jgi:hypothetical protein
MTNDYIKNPREFVPERFESLDPAEAKRLDPTNYVYGFGRRLGMHHP